MAAKNGRRTPGAPGEMSPRMIRSFTVWFIILGAMAFIGVILVLISAFVFHQG